MSRRICIVLTTRGNYGKMKSTMAAIQRHPDLSLQLVVGGILLGQDYDSFVEVIEWDGFTIDRTLDYIAAGQTLDSVVESAGRCTIAFGRILTELDPDVVMVIADRYECLSIAQAAMCRNTVIAHLEGGEVSGSIDERIRHAITKLAHIHFPANRDAADRLIRLGEIADTVHVVGTPSLDQLAGLDLAAGDDLDRCLTDNGNGAAVDLTAEYLVVSQHPVVTEYDDARRQFTHTADAVVELNIPTIWVLPNDDAGAQSVAGPLSALQSNGDAPPVRTISGLNFVRYAALIKNAVCLVGNTSSGIRESAFLGVPVVNIGNRQRGRQQGGNVVNVGHDTDEIVAATRRQIAHGVYPSDTVYGDGRAGEQIAACLAAPLPPVDKTLAY